LRQSRNTCNLDDMDGSRPINSIPDALEQRLHPDSAGASESGSILPDHPTQSSIAIDGWKSALFGLPFLAVGAWVSFCALGLSPIQSKNVPDWVIGIFGGVFFLSGLFFVTHGLLGMMRKIRYLRAAARNPGQPWLCDFHWAQDGIAFSAFNAMLGRLLAALGWTIFLLPFFWIGVSQRLWMFAIVASILGLFGLIFWYRWAQMLADLIRYGNSYLSYDAFPYFAGGTLRARLRAPHHLADIGALTLTLRCVREEYVTSGTGRDRSTKVVCYELYNDAVTLDHDRLASFIGGEIPIEFRLPADQPATTLASTPPLYWEIEANGQSQSVRYQAYFLVPVYKSS
jgi:hypothetical protein